MRINKPFADPNQQTSNVQYGTQSAQFYDSNTTNQQPLIEQTHGNQGYQNQGYTQFNQNQPNSQYPNHQIDPQQNEGLNIQSNYPTFQQLNNQSNNINPNVNQPKQI